MRSTFFVILSLFVHALCVAAIAVAPSRVAAPEGDDIEVQIGEPADQPGAENAPDSITEAAAPVTAEPVPPAIPEPEPEIQKPVTVAKASVQKTKVVMAPMEKVTKIKPKKIVETKFTELPPKEKVADSTPVATNDVANDEAKEETLDPEIEESPAAPAPVAATSTPEFIPVKEAAPAGVEAAESEATEPASEEGKGETPAAPATSKGAEPKEDAELAKGGATKAGAVSYLDLKQAQGNRSPQYPLLARKESRQGQVELLYRVTKDGNVADIQVAKSSGHKDLDQEAARAVAQFRFVPGQEGWARHPVSFALKGQTATLPSRLRSAQTE